MVIWNLNTSFGFSWRHCCELVLFFFLFSKKKEESILSSAYHWVALIKAKINFVCLYVRIPILLKDESILISTDLLHLRCYPFHHFLKIRFTPHHFFIFFKPGHLAFGILAGVYFYYYYGIFQ